MTGLHTTSTIIIVEDAPVGYQVRIFPDEREGHHELWCEHRDHARSYARGLAMDTGWEIEDRTHQPIVVEQLNSSQWHAVYQTGRCCAGVGDYVTVVASALVSSALRGRGVESVDLAGNRLVLVREEASHG